MSTAVERASQMLNFSPEQEQEPVTPPERSASDISQGYQGASPVDAGPTQADLFKDDARQALERKRSNRLHGN